MEPGPRDWNFSFLQSLHINAPNIPDSTGIAPDNKELFQKLGDRYSGYNDSITAEEKKNSFTSTNIPGAIGIRISLVATLDTIVIQSVADNSPAQDVGLQIGDRILAINDTSVVCSTN